MTLQIGDVRMGMEQDLRNVLELVLNKKRNLAHYWILVHAKYENEVVINSKVVVLPYQPPKMIGTVCYFINNKEGYYRQLWALPLDCPDNLQYELKDPNEDIYLASKDMPILYH